MDDRYELILTSVETSNYKKEVFAILVVCAEGDKIRNNIIDFIWSSESGKISFYSLIFIKQNMKILTKELNM